MKLEDNVLKIIFKKQLQIVSLIYEYLDNLKMTEQDFSEALNSCLKNGVCGEVIGLGRSGNPTFVWYLP